MKSIGILILGFILAGCAKFPANGGAGNNTRVTFTMTVDGAINLNRYYFVAIRWSKDDVPFGVSGPVPVVGPPWGNGFVAGRANVFVECSANDPNHPLIVSQFRDPVPDNSEPVNGQVYLSQWVQTGYPVNEDVIQPGTKTIRFTLDMSQIAANTADIPLIRSLQVNFLTMDRIPQGSDPNGKTFDSLGDTSNPGGLNQWVTISATRDGTYNNSTGVFTGLEPRLDCPEPDLDLVDWQIEVRRP